MKYKINEVPNENILCFHVTEKISSNLVISIDSMETFELFKDEMRKDEREFLKYLSGALLAIPGVIDLTFNKYEISVEKSEVFDWQDIEPNVIHVIKSIVAKGGELEELPRVICTEEERVRIKGQINRRSEERLGGLEYPDLELDSFNDEDHDG